MYNIPHVTMDSSVLAVPQITCTIEEVNSYIDKILDWSLLLDQPWVAISLTENGPGALSLDNLYPLRDHLKMLFAAHNIFEYDVNTVSRVVDRLLNHTPSFETYFKIKEILYEQIDTIPDIIRIVSSHNLQSDLARCVLLIAILRSHCQQPLGGHSLILRDAPAVRINVRAKIHDFEHDREDINGLVYQPEFFEGDILACDNFHGLIECLDESSIFTGATDDQGIEFAIRIYTYKNMIINREEPDWNNVLIPKIGHDFRRTCQQCCLDQDDSLPPRILRSIIETMEKQNMRAVHALRTGEGGDTPQRMRGNDNAQRRDIDRTFHLHYWDCEEGNIELASVVYHNDFSIPY